MKSTLFRSLTLVAAIACGLVTVRSYSFAQDGPSMFVAAPETLPALPVMEQPLMASPAVVSEEMVAPTSTEIQAIPVARIDYDVTHRAKKMFRDSPKVDLTMITQNPADKCFYQIPLCLPACCVGEPNVESYCGLGGRGVVKYCYACGLEVEVKFRLRGDVEVEYGT